MYNRKDGAHRSSYHYVYFLDGNQSRKTAKVSGKPDLTTDYQYDRLGRLTEEKEQGGSKIQYAYDRFSNRLKMTTTDVNNKITTTEYEYDLRNRLQTETKTYDGTEEILHYRYDFNGNQIHRQWEKFSPKKEKKTLGRVGFTSDKFKEEVVVLEKREYNGFNELTYVYRDAYETRYTYRPDGLRHKKLFADGTTLSHIWDGQNIVAEYAANGGITARYLRGITLIARDQDNLLQYYLFNAHGDVTQRTDQNGTALKNYDYDAFGVEKNPEIMDVNPWRFCGEYFDSSSGTYYLRNRHYSPGTGQFTQEDPIRSGLNWYVYCDGNPIMLIDPSGLEWGVVTGGAAGYENNTYQFIETSIKSIRDLKGNYPDEGGFWVIANIGYSDRNIMNFKETAKDLGVKLIIMDDKQQLFDYINNKGGTSADRMADRITNFAVFSHGYGDGNDAAVNGSLAFAHGHSDSYGALNILVSDISKLESYAFGNTSSWFGSCNTGSNLKSLGTSFAQEWVNKTGGHATAVVNGLTDYTNIHVWPGKNILNKFNNWYARRGIGYLETGSRNYPVASNGVEWNTFTPMR